MRTHRFGRKIKLPATIAIKHQIRKLMFEDAVKKAEAGARAEAVRPDLTFLDATMRSASSVPLSRKDNIEGRMSISALILILLLTFAVACVLDRSARSHSRLSRSSPDFGDPT
jgi:hypothetical protein